MGFLSMPCASRILHALRAHCSTASFFLPLTEASAYNGSPVAMSIGSLQVEPMFGRSRYKTNTYVVVTFTNMCTHVVYIRCQFTDLNVMVIVWSPVQLVKKLSTYCISFIRRCGYYSFRCSFLCDYCSIYFFKKNNADINDSWLRYVQVIQWCC